MGTENVYKLLVLAEKDAALVTEIKASGPGEAGAKAIVAIGHKRGLDFTLDELLKVTAEIRQRRASDAPLSDDDLGKVSGGIGGPPLVWSLPEEYFAHLSQSDSESISFNYQASDSFGGANAPRTPTVTITVHGRDEPPISSPTFFKKRP